MSTALDLIIDAMTDLGVLSAGEAPSSPDANYGLRQLNLMLDSWSTESLSVFAKRLDSFTLVPSTQTYPLGVGGTLDVSAVVIPRPEYITHAWTRDATGQDTPSQIMDQNRWDLIPLKSTTGSFPTAIFYDPQFPLGQYNVFPVPQQAYVHFLESMQQLAQFASLTDTVTFPPGYELALGKNLAMTLPGFGVAPSGNIQQLAGTSKANIERLNVKIHSNIMTSDVPRSHAGIHPYNILFNRPSR